MATSSSAKDNRSSQSIALAATFAEDSKREKYNHMRIASSHMIVIDLSRNLG